MSEADDQDANKELHNFYYFGSSVTLASSLFVIFSYLKFKACRQHPSGLIFWRSVADVIFSLQFIILFSVARPNDRHCDVFSFIFQFSILASCSWYFMNAVDLLRSMRNPFSEPAASMPLYHIYVWGIAIASSVAITTSKRVTYRRDMQLCWTTVSSGVFNYLNWLTFFIPTLFYYIFSIVTVVYAGARLKKGLDQTFATRQIVLWNGIRYVVGFCFYWTFAGIIYGIIVLEGSSTEPEASAGKGSNLPLYATFAVTIAFRGVVDTAIWVYNQKVLLIYTKWWTGQPHGPEDIGMKDVDINRALRSEVLIFSTTGMALAIDKANSIPASRMLPTLEQYPVSLDPKDPRNMHSVVEITVSRNDFSARAANPKSSSSPASRTSSDAAFDGGGGGGLSDHSQASKADVEMVPFLDYAPQVFRFLRGTFGIDESAYKASIQGQTESMIEKFTEGRGGAFFYFSEDGQYIVKTLTLSEGKFLSTKFLQKYVEYVARNRASLLSRFCGFHAITLYNLTIHFMVMQSVFLTTRKVHERYDLKGSFVDRHASKAQPKPTNSKGKGGSSKARRGAFRNVVFKDNDLNRTVRLSENDRLSFLHQVKKDAFFLRDCNIMDYSLLLGVHHTSHQVPLMSPLPHAQQQLQQQQQQQLLQQQMQQQRDSLMMSPRSGYGGAAGADGLELNPASVRLSSIAPSLGGSRADFSNSDSFQHTGGVTRVGTSMHLSPDGHGAAGGSVSQTGSSSSREALLLQERTKFRKDDGGVQASIIEGPGIYFFGLIDILQEYNTNKKMEHLAKVYLRCKNGLGISAIPPKPYADRFVKFMADITRTDEDDLIAEGMGPQPLSPVSPRVGGGGGGAGAAGARGSSPLSPQQRLDEDEFEGGGGGGMGSDGDGEEKDGGGMGSGGATGDVRLDMQQAGAKQRLFAGSSSDSADAEPVSPPPQRVTNAAAAASSGSTAAGPSFLSPATSSSGASADPIERAESPKAALGSMGITDSASDSHAALSSTSSGEWNHM